MTAAAPVRTDLIGLNDRNDFKDRRAGFTLIEIIATIIMLALMASMMWSVSGTALRGSADSLVRATAQARLTDAIESMTADYRELYATVADPIATIMTRIGTAGSAQNNTYGAYTVVVNRRIRFTGAAPAFSEQADSNGDILRVTISVDGSTATTLFSR
ncbi:type II secretion system GspH family protein [Nitratidesulfovibrio sp. HK-II]|uniref:PulJ/GspJ family protein n=1 Tax=Nitratidesulfovibrio sp. HK-II TaxID=2009266 RepID=UPI000E2E66EE|nr:type II secretion system protein [Nitratidesulfovibrio sp. HK-II]